jgi:hypothetical protein
MYGSFAKAQGELASISEAYLALLEKRHKKEQEDKKPSESDVEKVARELEKVADELKEAALSIFESTEGKITVSPMKFDELMKKVNHFSFSPSEVSQILQTMEKKGRKAADPHDHIHGENDMDGTKKGVSEALEQALVEALTDTDFEGKAKVASTSADANLLAALAQSHMSENVAGAVDICNHVARNPNTPKHILEKLAKHSDPKVVESASNNLTARDSQVNEALMESWNNGKGTLDDDYVARQFAAGKPAERKNAKTDGKIYWLHGNEIARQHGEPGKMEFNWAGWYTPTTERHLNTILKQVAPGKSVQKKLHKDQGIERFTLDHFKAPDPGKDAEKHPAS